MDNPFKSLYFSILLTERENCYWVKETNQRLVQRHMHGAQTPVSNDAINSQLTAWKRKSLFPLVGRFLFSLRMRHPFFLLGTSESFSKFNSFLFFFLIQLFFKKYIYSFPTCLQLGARPRNPRFSVYLTLPDRQDSINPGKIPWTIWLLYFDQVSLRLLHNKFL